VIPYQKSLQLFSFAGRWLGKHSKLFSPEHSMPSASSKIGLYQQLHAHAAYGNTSVKNLRFLRPHLTLRQPASLLDYGCGQSRLLEALEMDENVQLTRYDPAIPAFSARPSVAADVLLNIDVLEHVPESELDAVLADMRSLGKDAVIVIDTQPAVQILANGENAHCTLHDAGWWAERLRPYFPVLTPIRVARRGRAAFITWDYSFPQKIRFAVLRLREQMGYIGNKMLKVFAG
jgi:hypothetical protein